MQSDRALQKASIESHWLDIISYASTKGLKGPTTKSPLSPIPSPLEPVSLRLLSGSVIPKPTGEFCKPQSVLGQSNLYSRSEVEVEEGYDLNLQQVACC